MFGAAMPLYIMLSHRLDSKPADERKLGTLLRCFCLLKWVIRCGGSLRINIITAGVSDSLVERRLALQSILRCLTGLLLGLGLLKGVVDCSSCFGVCRRSV